METIRKSSARERLRWLFRQARPAGVWIGLSVVLGWFSGLLLVAQARYLARIIHGSAMEGAGRDGLWPLFPVIAGLILARSLLGWGREWAGFQASATVRHHVRTRLADHMIRLGPAYLTREKSGALSTVVMERVEGLHGFFAHYLPQLALAVMIPLAFLAVIFPVSWAAGGMLLITAPLIPLFMVLVGMGADSVSQRHFQALSWMSAHFLDTLQGLTTLKLFHRSRSAEQAVAEVSDAYRRRTMRVLRIAFLSSAVLEFFSAIAIALVAVYLGMTYLGYYNFGTWGRTLTLSGGFFILLLAPEFYLPLRELGTHYHARAEAVGAAGAIMKVLAARVPEKSPLPAVPPAGRIDIALEDVHVIYEDRELPALDGVSFGLDAGEKLVIVGESGAGKTTIFNLLLGFRRPDRGRVRVNGTPLENLESVSWRRNLAWIGQDPVLFFGTIRANIRMGRPHATDTEIEDAARSAGVREFAARMPAGMETRVGERGYGLSRGQIQRIALARAFLKDPPILLLDEPTAGLDADSERWVLRALENLSANRTVLTLAHRLAGIGRADRILVMSQGKIVEQGTFAALRSAGGVFSRLLDRAPAGGVDG